MQEYELGVLEQYNIEVISTRKTRGAILCDTDQGLLLLKEVRVSEKRIPALFELYEYLYSQGYGRIDRIILTRRMPFCAGRRQQIYAEVLVQGPGVRCKETGRTACGVRQPGETSYIDVP